MARLGRALHDLVGFAVEQARHEGGGHHLVAVSYTHLEHPAVVGGGGADGHVVGLVGLHHDPPVQLGAPGAARHLLDELEGALAGAVVRQVQLGVGVDDAHQRDVVEIEPLGDHLGAEQHGGIGGGERFQQGLVGAFGLGGVGTVSYTHLRREPERADGVVAEVAV